MPLAANVIEGSPVAASERGGVRGALLADPSLRGLSPDALAQVLGCARLEAERAIAGLVAEVTGARPSLVTGMSLDEAMARYGQARRPAYSPGPLMHEAAGFEVHMPEASPAFLDAGAIPPTTASPLTQADVYPWVVAVCAHETDSVILTKFQALLSDAGYDVFAGEVGARAASVAAAAAVAKTASRGQAVAPVQNVAPQPLAAAARGAILVR